MTTKQYRATPYHLIIDENIAHRIVSILDKALHTGIAAEMDRKVRLAKEFALAKLRLRY